MTASTAITIGHLARSLEAQAGQPMPARVLSDTVADPWWTAPRVVHRWQEPPGTLVQPRLPFGGIAARPSGPAPTSEGPQMTLKAVERGAYLVPPPTGNRARKTS
ncbi:MULTISPECIES: hypothetical protein [Streptomyces]|uniref:Uncharacterized protein n=1 Tax=Streptomyces canarius TaxID=285453 RepID=A0ABQ3CZX7_9ACTN|nr:hypothetical protein [Streptomyces canarius]GHA51800.1 hypothetical protein GCM10010345_65500 [Streptomyces canarius]